jgi:hypothetical protein
MVELPSFHDGHLDGFITTGKAIALYLRNVAGQKYTLLSKDLRLFRGDNFRAGNILFDVTVRKASELVPSEIAQLLDLTDDHARAFDHEQWLRKARQDVVLLVESTASYGAECRAVCADIALSRVSSAVDRVSVRRSSGESFAAK